MASVTPLVSDDVVRAFCESAGWEFVPAKHRIERTFVRNDFSDAAMFITRIAAIADRHDHHPDILLNRYQCVRVMLTTHSSGGVTQKDLDLAREISSLPQDQD